MSHTVIAACLGTIALAAATPALADPITITTNSTGVAALTYAEEGGVIREQTYPFTINGNNSVAVSTFVGSTSASASASIATDLSDLSRMRSSGSTNVSHSTQTGSAEGVATADFFVFFQLAVPHTYRFAGDFVTSGGSVAHGGRLDWSEWVVDFLEMNPDMSINSEVIIEKGNHTTSLERSGLLPAGIYRFVVLGTARTANLSSGSLSGSQFANFSFGLDLTDAATPTPEPASLLLIATGLGGVLAARRRRRQV